MTGSGICTGKEHQSYLKGLRRLSQFFYFDYRKLHYSGPSIDSISNFG